MNGNKKLTFLPKHKKQNQAGRSLLEMLGVLGIMGVITITFIIAYQVAWNKHQANVVISGVATMAVSTSGQLVIKNDFDLNEFKGANEEHPYIRGTYPVIAKKKYNGQDNLFGLSVSKLPERVCNFILSAKWKMPFEIKVNEEDGVCDDREEENTILFIFNENLLAKSEGAGTPEEDNSCTTPCADWQTCYQGSCVCAPSKLPSLTYAECQARSGFACSYTGSYANLGDKLCNGPIPTYHYTD